MVFGLKVTHEKLFMFKMTYNGDTYSIYLNNFRSLHLLYLQLFKICDIILHKRTTFGSAFLLHTLKNGINGSKYKSRNF